MNPKSTNKRSVLLGAHMSIAGGMFRALERGESIGCTAIQVFTKNNNRWRAKPLTDAEVLRWHEQWEKSPIRSAVAHNSYLINMASPDKALVQKSIDSMALEIERCEQLRIPFIVIHPGAYIDDGITVGIERLVTAINTLHNITQTVEVQICLETTAGQGTSIGYQFEHLAEIRSWIDAPYRLGVCIDTCHIFAAGYDIRDRKTYLKTFREFDKIVGLQHLKVIHLNDSKAELGSRVDRHEHIGKGNIGLKAFQYILEDRRFRDIPKILETPKSADMHEDIENLKILKKLIKS